MRTVLRLGLELKEDLKEKGLEINDNFIVKVFDNSIDFVLSDEDGHRVFGGEVSVTGFTKFRGDFDVDGREIKINKGSLGAVDNTCFASVATTNLMCMAFNDWEEFAETMEVFMDEARRILMEREAGELVETLNK